MAIILRRVNRFFSAAQPLPAEVREGRRDQARESVLDRPETVWAQAWLSL